MQTTYSPWTDTAPHKQAPPKYVVRAQWAGAYRSCKPAPWRQAPSPRQGWMRSPGAAKAPPEQMPSTSSGKAAPNKGTGTDNTHSGRRGSAGPKPQKSWNSSLRNLNNLVVQLKSLIWERREKKNKLLQLILLSIMVNTLLNVFWIIFLKSSLGVNTKKRFVMIWETNNVIVSVSGKSSESGKWKLLFWNEI